jgi:hypothetical protein
VLTRTIRKRLSLFQDTLIVEYQGGFRKGKSSTDQIFTLRMLQKQSFEQNLNFHILFIGFKKTYDSIERNKLYQAMKKLKIPKKLIGLTRMTLTDTQNKISADERLLESFGRKIGVRQEDSLSTMMFNIVLETVFRNSEIHTQGIIYHRKQQVIAYADDVALITKSKKRNRKSI